jgi:hypothetical protein
MRRWRPRNRIAPDAGAGVAAHIERARASLRELAASEMLESAEVERLSTAVDGFAAQLTGVAGDLAIDGPGAARVLRALAEDLDRRHDAGDLVGLLTSIATALADASVLKLAQRR